MKKLIMVATMLALTLVVTVPAFAAHRNNDFNNNRGNNFNNDGVAQAPTETFVSGTNTNNGGSVQGGGDNSNTCAAQENFNNSGGVLNQPSLQQVDNTRSNDGRFFDNRGRRFDNGRRFSGNGFSGNGFSGGGATFLGPSFTNAPSQSASCNPSVEQAASSSSG